MIADDLYRKSGGRERGGAEGEGRGGGRGRGGRGREKEREREIQKMYIPTIDTIGALYSVYVY